MMLVGYMIIERIFIFGYGSLLDILVKCLFKFKLKKFYLKIELELELKLEIKFEKLSYYLYYLY